MRDALRNFSREFMHYLCFGIYVYIICLYIIIIMFVVNCIILFFNTVGSSFSFIFLSLLIITTVVACYSVTTVVTLWFLLG